MSLQKRIKLVRANYAVKFTLPHLYNHQIDVLAEALKDVPEEERDAFRKDFIEKHHELRFVISRLSDEEKKGVDRVASKAMEANNGGVLSYVDAYQEDIWPKIKRHIEKGLEKGEDGAFTEVEKDTVKEYLETIEKFSRDEITFIIRAYNDAEAVDKERAEADPNFTGKVSAKAS